jgi:uncharacterized membrane protein
MITRIVYVTLLGVLGLGCAAGSEMQMDAPVQKNGTDLQTAANTGYGKPAAQTPDDVQCGDDTPSYDEVAVFNVCVHCHSSANTGTARNSAPAAINFDTEASAQTHAAEAVHVVMLGAMPPRATGITLTDEEKQQLYQWAMCTL